jgi:hypothetical protein
MILPPEPAALLSLFEAAEEKRAPPSIGSRPSPARSEGRIARRQARKKPSSSVSAHLTTLSIDSPPWVSFATITVWTAWL